MNTPTKTDIITELSDVRDMFKNSYLANIIERAIIEIEQLRSDHANVQSDMYAGVRLHTYRIVHWRGRT